VDIGRCESCGRDEEQIVAVLRVYLTTAQWDQPEQVRVMPEVERWCAVCRDHYPHTDPE
jgi:hypothetical protein